ncbi:MAG: 16S rRNA (cytosine(1402)-N(4))-methyltransferase RsmH [Campylobacteraceae bacterium]|jgi:16S rRNA (cytosine1402-N4)-methyltransferase|nr:16S rRNA (cytosine(1402)-N(4))-methyltransferase RsmH [Campylobacteraceae bacterium]
MNTPHKPVLLNEVLEVFKELENGVFVDATLGYGGHSEAILSAHPNIKLIGVDRDDEALSFSKERLKKYADRVSFVKSDFGSVFSKIDASNVVGILADIGVSSLQLDKKERGFSFESETLDMRMDNTQEFSAYDVVNGYSELELEKIIRVYGEERFSKKIASLIVKRRKEAKITSAKELATLISANFRGGKIHPATLTFQAIRIEVNSELEQLENLLESVKNIGKNEKILGIISFHSLEDRIVKTAFKEWSRSCICPPEAFRCTCKNNNELGEIITKKPLTATDSEIKANPRARSAKLRAFRFYGND